ncbi:MAG TPA: hypothetical protein VGG41_08655 [Solirubrobacteraceae bacterium]
MRRANATALLCAAALCGFGAISAPAALASHSETVFFEAPGSLLDVSAQSRTTTLAQLQSLGVHALRIVLYWRNVAPNPNHKRKPAFNQENPAHYRWGNYDQLIDAAAALHWKILLTVTGPVPRWATPHGEDIRSNPNPGDFHQFMIAVGRHYGKLVKLYSIWNEPNQPGFLRPQYVGKKLTSPRIYRGLFLAGYSGLKASGNFNRMTVLMGETSSVGVVTQGVPAPLAFLRGVLCLNSNYKPIGHCARLPADGYAQHPYDNAHGPFAHPPKDDVTMGTIGRLITALNRAAAVGAIHRGLPVFVTEFGVQTKPNPYVGVTYAQQAEFDAIAEHIAWKNPRIVSFSQYLLRDDHPVRGRVVGSQAGLENYHGVAKPALQGFRLPLTVTRTRSGVALWGIVRPETVAGPFGPIGPSLPGGTSGATGSTGATAGTGSSGSTGTSGSGGVGAAASGSTVLIQYSANGGRTWRSLRTVRIGVHGSWSANGPYAGFRLWRVRWISPTGEAFVGAAIRTYTTFGRIDF